MERREFFSVLGSTPFASLTPNALLHHQQQPIVYHYWDVANRFAEVIRDVAPESSQGLVDRVARSVVESATAALAGARDDAQRALSAAVSLGSDVWNALTRAANDLGLDGFDQYRQRTVDWLARSLEEWARTNQLPTYQIDRERAECFFRRLREQAFCVEAPLESAFFCAAIGMLGLVGGAPGFLTVFGACLRKRVPRIVLSVAVNCLRPAANECFAA